MPIWDPVKALDNSWPGGANALVHMFGRLTVAYEQVEVSWCPIIWLTVCGVCVLQTSSRGFRDKYTGQGDPGKYCQMLSMVGITQGKLAPFPGGILLKAKDGTVGNRSDDDDDDDDEEEEERRRRGISLRRRRRMRRIG
jgi:hypothetical protein